MVRKNRASSGLIRYDSRNENQDWAQVIREAIAATKPKFIVMMVGLNDRVSIRDRVSVVTAPAGAGPKAAAPAASTPKPAAPEQPDAKADAKTDAKTDAKADAKTDSKTEPKTESKTESPRPSPRPSSRPTPNRLLVENPKLADLYRRLIASSALMRHRT